MTLLSRFIQVVSVYLKFDELPEMMTNPHKHTITNKGPLVSNIHKSSAAPGITLTISTLSGDYTHPFPKDVELKHVVKEVIDALHIVDRGSWILEHNGVELDHRQTIEQARLNDGNVLTLNPEEGGGGSIGR